MIIIETASDRMRVLNERCALLFQEIEEKKVEEKKEKRRVQKLKRPEKKIKLDDKQAEAERVRRERPTSRREPQLPAQGMQYVISLELLLMDDNDYVVQPTGGLYCQLDRALAHLHYAHGRYGHVRAVIEQMVTDELPMDLENELEMLWDNSSYKLELEQNLNLRLNSVNMYRIRRRNPCPTLQRSGPKKYRISLPAMELLNGSFASDPKPNRKIKQHLANCIGSKVEVVSNWFKNKRQRCKRNLASQASSAQTTSTFNELMNEHYFMQQEEGGKQQQQQTQPNSSHYLTPEAIANGAQLAPPTYHWVTQQQQPEQPQFQCQYQQQQQPDIYQEFYCEQTYPYYYEQSLLAETVESDFYMY